MKAGKVLLVSLGGLFVLLLALVFGVIFGATSVDLRRALTEPGSLDHRKVFDLRLPRALAAGIVGGSLAVAGLVFQALMRNALASPYVLGVSAGGSLGAVLALVLGVPFIPGGAFLGATLTIVLVYAIAFDRGRVASSSLLLAGVVVNSFLSACIMLINVLTDPRNQDRILRWLVGSFHDTYDGPALGLGFLGLVASALLVFFHARELNLLSLGDAVADRSGVPVARARTLLYLAASLLTAIAVSLAGPIGFVGLIVPHLLRMLLGPDHRLLVPMAIGVGGAFLIVVDVVAHLAWSSPLPTGVVTAFLGGPLFLFLLKRGDRARAGLHG